MPAPQKPSRLALWINKHGDPDQLKVEYRQTGTETADTWVILTCTHTKKSIEVGINEIGTQQYGEDDVLLHLSHASIVELTDAGRKRVVEWKAFLAREAKDLSEFERLKKKFAPAMASRSEGGDAT
jgi:hypothetical protein